MWHRNLINVLAIAQYLSYLIVGALYYLLFAALAGFAVTIMAAWGRVILGHHYPADGIAGFMLGRNK